MLQLSNESRMLCGVLLITVPSVEYGGVFLLGMLRKREPGYMDNPLRQNLFRAGHAHAGVLVLLSLVCQVLVDSIVLPAPAAWIARLGAPAAALLVPGAFFFLVASPKAERPNGLIRLAYVGALLMVAFFLALVGLAMAIYLITLRSGTH